jgi:hypothetical protein
MLVLPTDPCTGENVCLDITAFVQIEGFGSGGNLMAWRLLVLYFCKKEFFFLSRILRSSVAGLAWSSARSRSYFR